MDAKPVDLVIANVSCLKYFALLFAAATAQTIRPCKFKKELLHVLKSMHRVCIYELILELYHATGFIFIISQKKNITQKYSKFEENVMKKDKF